MADCPMCGSRLDVYKFRWITNVIGLTNPFFKCPACNWKMRVDEVHRRGGLHAIKRGLSRGGGRYNPLDPSRNSGKGKKRNGRGKRSKGRDKGKRRSRGRGR